LLQVKVMNARLAAAQQLDADTAAAQEEVAALMDRLAAKKAELSAAVQQTTFLQSITAGTSGATMLHSEDVTASVMQD
jgi:hypothetical protein